MPNQIYAALGILKRFNESADEIREISLGKPKYDLEVITYSTPVSPKHVIEEVFLKRDQKLRSLGKHEYQQYSDGSRESIDEKMTSAIFQELINRLACLEQNGSIRCTGIASLTANYLNIHFRIPNTIYRSNPQQTR